VEEKYFLLQRQMGVKKTQHDGPCLWYLGVFLGGGVFLLNSYLDMWSGHLVIPKHFTKFPKIDNGPIIRKMSKMCTVIILKHGNK
jgi:hypothetical protein